MKKILLTVALVGGLSSAAYAGDMGVTVSSDYAIEAEKWSSNIAYSKLIAGVTVTPALDFSYYNNGKPGGGGMFDGSSIGASYPLSSSLTATSKLGITNKWKYEELTVGLSFSF